MPMTISGWVRELVQARAAMQSAETELAETLAARNRVLRAVLPPACGLLLAAAIIALVVGLFRGFRYHVAAAGSLVLATAAALLLAVNMGGPKDAAPQAEFAAHVDDLAAAVPKTAELDAVRLGEDGLNDQFRQMPPRGEAAGTRRSRRTSPPDNRMAMSRKTEQVWPRPRSMHRHRHRP